MIAPSAKLISTKRIATELLLLLTNNYATLEGAFVFRGHGGALAGGLTDMAYLSDYGRGYAVMINSCFPGTSQRLALPSPRVPSQRPGADNWLTIRRKLLASGAYRIGA